jgi:DNA-binding response OmpR family regulator
MADKAKILLIDDDYDVIAIVQSRLEAYGYIVVTAHSGETGMEEIKKQNPDLIILDVMLPGMNGYEVCTYIKGDKELTRPVVMLTSCTRDSDRQLGAVSKADAFVLKYKSSESLIPEIEKLLSSHST